MLIQEDKKRRKEDKRGNRKKNITYAYHQKSLP